MALRMPRPIKDRHGTYYVVRRVPKDLLTSVGKQIFKESLGTKDAAEAKRRCLEVLAAFDARCAALRRGTTTITEREAHELARVAYDNLVEWHRDYPSQSLPWIPKFYSQLWTRDVSRAWEPSSEHTFNLNAILIKGMRDRSYEQADNILEENGLIVDERSRTNLAKAVGAAFQRACETLAKLAEGYGESDHVPRLSDPAVFGNTCTIPPPESLSGIILIFDRAFAS